MVHRHNRMTVENLAVRLLPWLALAGSRGITCRAIWARRGSRDRNCMANNRAKLCWSAVPHNGDSEDERHWPLISGLSPPWYQQSTRNIIDTDLLMICMNKKAAVLYTIPEFY